MAAVNADGHFGRWAHVVVYRAEEVRPAIDAALTGFAVTAPS